MIDMEYDKAFSAFRALCILNGVKPPVYGVDILWRGEIVATKNHDKRARNLNV